jgi:hypothetical protein
MGSIVGYLSIPGAEAGADLSGNQYRGVILDSTERRFAAVTNANAQKPLGIQQDDPAAVGRPIDIAYFGICKAEAGAAITYLDDLAMDNSGRVITDVEVADGGAVDLHHVATALEAAGAAGDIITVMVKPAQRIGSE